MDPRDALDQGGLSRAVVADERGDLAGAHGQVDVVQDLHGAEALGHTAQGEDGVGHFGHLPRGRRPGRGGVTAAARTGCGSYLMPSWPQAAWVSALQISEALT